MFDPAEVVQALEIPLGEVRIDVNSFGTGLLAGEPFEACCFPYAQHFQTTSAPSESPVADREGLEKAARSRARSLGEG